MFVLAFILIDYVTLLDSLVLHLGLMLLVILELFFTARYAVKFWHEYRFTKRMQSPQFTAKLQQTMWVTSLLKTAYHLSYLVLFSVIAYL